MTDDQHATRQTGVATHCTLAIPTYGLWYACYIAIMVMVGLVIPFTIFYYEADSETCALAGTWAQTLMLSFKLSSELTLLEVLTTTLPLAHP